MRFVLHDGFHLSPIRDGDQMAFVEHFSDKATTDGLLKVPYPHTKQHAEYWVRFCVEAADKQPYETRFAFRRKDGYLIGGAGIILNGGAGAHRGEIGYWVAKDYRGRGVATAGIRELSVYGFDTLDLSRIEATPFSHNQASQRVLEKAGYSREGLLKGYHVKDGNAVDACLYALVKAPPS